MKHILLSCSSGMSTSLLVSKMEEAAKEQNFAAKIWAVGQDQAESEMEKADVVLVGPQMRFMKKKLQKKTDELGIPIDVIDPMSYGRVDGKAVFKKALELIENN